MTEAEWLTATDPTLILGFLQPRVNERKMRLYTVACCRTVWDSFRDERSKRAIEAGELYADGDLGAETLDTFLTEANNAFRSVQRHYRKSGKSHGQIPPALSVLILARLPAWPTQSESVTDSLIDSMRRVTNGGESVATVLVYEIFGNPFRPITLNPSWLTSTVLALAQQMYDSRDFSTMPILADALQDAGCDNEDILNHCRQPGEHVRGCFVVDLLLGKT